MNKEIIQALLIIVTSVIVILMVGPWIGAYYSWYLDFVAGSIYMASH
jgi:hypothetical protein